MKGRLPAGPTWGPHLASESTAGQGTSQDTLDCWQTDSIFGGGECKIEGEVVDLKLWGKISTNFPFLGLRVLALNHLELGGS